MTRRLLILAVAAATTGLVGCDSTPPLPALGPDGAPLPQVYTITQTDAAHIPFRMLDALNALRQATGLDPVALNPGLTAAAATHALDMFVQNRPWHFGSDGSSPIERAARSGYTGTLLGETLSETYENELDTLVAWMRDPGPRSVIMNARAEDIGFGFFQEPDGKIWWVLNAGHPDIQGVIPQQKPPPGPSRHP